MALSILTCFILLAGCFATQPRNVHNVCAIFSQYPQWYWAAEKTKKRWGVPIHVLMAIMYQESRFQATVRPDRTKLLGFIPWTRPSTADGYAQAEYRTWWRYRHETGNLSARRSNFKNAIDFVGWYAYQAHKRLGIPRDSTYDIYLAYHDGIGGYSRGNFHHQPRLRHIAWKVHEQAHRYHEQLKQCQNRLPNRPWW